MIRLVSASLRAACCLLLMPGCAPSVRHQPAAQQFETDEGRLREPPGPEYPEQPGKDALRGWARQCYERGLAHNPVFSRGGTLVVQWTADRGGDLLQLEFPTDSFRGWEIDRRGQSLAECIVALAREGKVVWSRQGTAPLRFGPSQQTPTSQPATIPAAEAGARESGGEAEPR